MLINFGVFLPFFGSHLSNNVGSNVTYLVQFTTDLHKKRIIKLVSNEKAKLIENISHKPLQKSHLHRSQIHFHPPHPDHYTVLGNYKAMGKYTIVKITLVQTMMS